MNDVVHLQEDGEIPTSANNAPVGSMSVGDNLEKMLTDPIASYYGVWKKNNLRSIKKVKKDKLKSLLDDGYTILKRY